MLIFPSRCSRIDLPSDNIEMRDLTMSPNPLGILFMMHTAHALQPADPPDATRSEQPQIPPLRPSKLEIVDLATNLDPQQQLSPFAQDIQPRTRSSQNVSLATNVQPIHSKCLSQPDWAFVSKVVPRRSVVDVERVNCSSAEFVESVSRRSCVGGHAFEIRYARVADVHRPAVRTDPNPVRLAKGVFYHAHGSGRRPEAEGLRAQDRVCRDVDGVAVPGVCEVDVASAVDDEIVWAAQLLAVVVVEESLDVSGGRVEFVDAGCLIDGAAVGRAWEGETCFGSPINFALVVFAAVDCVYWWCCGIVVDYRGAAVEVDNLLLVHALMRLREYDGVQSWDIDWRLMDAVISGIENMLQLWCRPENVKAPFSIKDHKGGICKLGKGIIRAY